MESHLLQMRGLKPNRSDINLINDFVASFTDAWIETNWQNDAGTNFTSHLLQMRGLKLPASLLFVPPLSRIFYRCVD